MEDSESPDDSEDSLPSDADPSINCKIAIAGRYYHASGERRAVIWRAVSNEKPIIVKNIAYFRNYF